MISDSSIVPSDSLLMLFEKSLSKIDIDGDSLFVVEGDLLMDEDELYYYLNKRLSESLKMKYVKDLNYSQFSHESTSFSVATNPRTNTPLIWPDNYHVTYSILRNSFKSEEQYKAVIQLLGEATYDWMRVCNVHFDYKPQYDNLSPTVRQNDSVTFFVKGIDVQGSFVAQAFFPNDPPLKRRLLIDPLFFSTNLNFSQAGILRHELGHIIGARHEQIWSKDIRCSGGSVIEGRISAIQLTEYDPYSVMHYLCGNRGTRSLISRASKSQ